MLYTPPTASADARSTPRFWRKRTCTALSAPAGSVTFENPIATWSSTADQNGTGWGTVPMNATANGTLVRSDTTSASVTHAQFASCSGVPELGGIADPQEDDDDGGQAADRHDGRPDPGARRRRLLVGIVVGHRPQPRTRARGRAP